MISKKTRDNLLKLKEERKQQLEYFEDLVKPFKDNLELINDVLRHQADIKQLMQHSKICRIYLHKIFRLRK